MGSLLLTGLAKGQSRTKDWKTAPIGNYVEIDKSENGFLRYRGKVGDCEIIALSHDLGSAGPDSDLILYVSSSSGIYEVLSLPVFVHRLYWVHESGGKLLIVLSKGFLGPDIEAEAAEPLLVIDLQQLTRNYKGVSVYKVIK